MKKKLQKIKKDLCFIAKENAPAFLLAIIITTSAIFISQLLYRQKPMIKRGYEIEIGKDGKPVAKKIEKVVDLAELLKLADFDRGAKIFKNAHHVITLIKAKVQRLVQIFTELLEEPKVQCQDFLIPMV